MGLRLSMFLKSPFFGITEILAILKSFGKIPSHKDLLHIKTNTSGTVFMALIITLLFSPLIPLDLDIFNSLTISRKPLTVIGTN